METQQRQTIALITHHISTPLGEMIACATDSALCMLEFADRNNVDAQTARIRSLLKASLTPGSNAILDQVEEELSGFFAGTLQVFSLPIIFPGTPFQMSVWSRLQEIPYGETWSYSRLTKSLGDMKAIRAVARANGENRIAIIIPCHRVVGSDGSLTGYAGGLWRKKELLELEGATSPAPEGQESLF